MARRAQRMAARHVTLRRLDEGWRCQFPRILRPMTSATPVILRTRKPVDAILHRAASVTIRKLIAKPQVMELPSDSVSVMRSTAGANVSGAQTVTATQRACRKNARSVLLGRSNISLKATTPALVVIMEGVPSEAIWISRIAAEVTRA